MNNQLEKHPHNTVELYEDRVVKTGQPELICIEAEKTIRGYEIGQRTGLFKSPRVIDFDKQKGVLVLEYIHGLSSIREVARGKYDPDSLGEKVGKCLAVIHNELKLPIHMRKELPPEFALGGQNVFLHGDFNTTNVCVSENNDSTTILDWQMTDMHGGNATYGSNYFDITSFINTSFSKPFYEYGRLPVVPMLRGFLRGYIEKFEGSWDENSFICYIEHVFKLKMKFRRENKKKKKRVPLILGHSLWFLFIQRQKLKQFIKH